MGLIRLLLALAVVLYHCRVFHLTLPWFDLIMTGGDVSVEMFFIISGFFMAMVLSEKYDEPGGFGLFLMNRTMRLLPTYWFVLLLAAGFYVVIYHMSGKLPQFVLDYFRGPTLTQGSLSYIVFSNFFLLGQDWSAFLAFNDTGQLFFTRNYLRTAFPAQHYMAIPQAWSLGTEWTFYLLAPLLVRRNVILLIILIALSIFVRHMAYLFNGNLDSWNIQFFPSELALFLIGILGFRLGQHYRFRPHAPLAMLACASFIIAILIYQLIPDFGHAFGIEFKRWFFYGIALFAIPLVFRCTKEDAFDRYLGRLSYPLYLIHGLVISAALEFSLGYVGPILAVSLILSALLVFCCEHPIDLLRNRLTKKHLSSVYHRAA